MNIWLIIFLMVISTIVGSFGSIFLKKGSKHFNIKLSFKGMIDILKNWEIILGVFLYGLATIAFIYMLKTEDLSMLYPLTSMGYIFVTIFSMYFLKEHMNWYKWTGILLIIVGVFFVTMH